MAQQRLTRESLFNSPLFSDVTIRQTYKGVSKDYHGHKAVLCGGSTWFMRALTGHFVEAQSRVVEVHDDRPDYFEVMLRYLYTHEYDATPISARHEDALPLPAQGPLGVHAIADKYDVRGLKDKCAAQFTKGIVNLRLAVTGQKALVDYHYNHCLDKDCLLGKALCAYLVKVGARLVKEQSKELAGVHPNFASDMFFAALANNGKLW